jgi:hypothetical protein
MNVCEHAFTSTVFKLRHFSVINIPVYALMLIFALFLGYVRLNVGYV